MRSAFSVSSIQFHCTSENPHNTDLLSNRDALGRNTVPYLYCIGTWRDAQNLLNKTKDNTIADITAIGIVNTPVNATTLLTEN